MLLGEFPCHRFLVINLHQFSVTGSDISSDAHDTTSIALEDMDGDGHLDLVAGNDIQANRLYRRRLYHTG